MSDGSYQGFRVEQEHKEMTERLSLLQKMLSGDVKGDEATDAIASITADTPSSKGLDEKVVKGLMSEDEDTWGTFLCTLYDNDQFRAFKALSPFKEEVYPMFEKRHGRILGLRGDFLNHVLGEDALDGDVIVFFEANGSVRARSFIV